MNNEQWLFLKGRKRWVWLNDWVWLKDWVDELTQRVGGVEKLKQLIIVLETIKK